MRKKVNVTRWLFILPAVIIVGLLLIYPVIVTGVYSFTNKNLIKPTWRFVGFANYIKVLSDGDFFNAFGNSIKWVVFSLLGQILIGFTSALCLNKIHFGKGVYKTLLIIPWAFPSIIIALIWKWLLNGVSGFIPNLLVKIGICKELPQFFSTAELVFPTLVFINIWFGAPLIMVNVLSALQTVPQDQYEAAKIDGATHWQSFKYITFPHIRTVVGLLIVLRTIWVFNNFDIIYLITAGGPANRSETVPIYAYNLGWGVKLLGRASAVCMLLLLFLLIVCMFYFKVLDKWDKEGE